MDTPYASGTESLASQIVVEAGDGLLCQVRQRRVSNAREDVAIDQIAVSTLGVAVPLAAVAVEPLAAPLPNRQVVFFLHIIASFLANEQYHRKQKIATGKNGIFSEE